MSGQTSKPVRTTRPFNADAHRERLRRDAWWMGWDDFQAGRPRPAHPHAAEGWQAAFEAARIPVALVRQNFSEAEENNHA